RVERHIDHDINRAGPAPGLGAQWSARWTGELVPPGPGAYRLVLDVPACWKYCKSHDAARLWIDGKQVATGEIQKGRIEVAFDSDGRAVPFKL
ncbi:PA14 domain-containing protein, partial [Klebsiella pneumoniae]